MPTTAGTLLLTAALASATLAASQVRSRPATVECAERDVAAAATETGRDPRIAGEIMDLTDQRRDTMYWALHNRGASLDEVHGSWISQHPREEGVLGLWPVAGQTRIATRAAPIVLEGPYVGQLRQLRVQLFVHTPQAERVKDLDELAITLAIDGMVLFDGPVKTARHRGVADCHTLYYGAHNLGFEGIAQALSAQGVRDDGHTIRHLRLSLAPADTSRQATIPFVVDTHMTPAAIMANVRTSAPVHDLG